MIGANGQRAIAGVERHKAQTMIAVSSIQMSYVAFQKEGCRRITVLRLGRGDACIEMFIALTSRCARRHLEIRNSQPASTAPTCVGALPGEETRTSSVVVGGVALVLSSRSLHRIGEAVVLPGC